MPQSTKIDAIEKNQHAIMLRVKITDIEDDLKKIPTKILLTVTSQMKKFLRNFQEMSMKTRR